MRNINLAILAVAVLPGLAAAETLVTERTLSVDAALVLANVTTAEGALLIRAGSEIVGAIGVSGAPGGDKDAACAQSGIDRIAKGLGG